MSRAKPINRRRWTEAERALVRREYPTTLTATIASQMQRSVSSVHQQAYNMGLHKSPEFLASEPACRWQKGGSAGQAFQFRKGHQTHNKGLKRPGWAPGRMGQTQFKPGSKPRNWVPVLSERFCSGYLQIKITDTGYPPRDWQPLHVLVWVEHHGPMPPGHIVVFRDGKRDNFAIENLELITRAENMRRNTIHNRVPPDLRPIVMSLGQIKRRIRERIQQIEDNQPEHP